MSTDGTGSAVSTRWELFVVAALLALPVAVAPGTGVNPTLVSLWGLVNVGAPGSSLGIDIYPVWTYFATQPRSFGSLPASIRVWPLATAFHLVATISAGSGVAVGREDRRVTGGLLVLAALASLWVAVGVAGRFGAGTASGWPAVLPVGAVATLSVAASAYRHDLRAVVIRG
ncbi:MULTISPECIES: TIGR04206 family protein [Haloferacaceae]|uniref:TIGR04206 family protein n=1 Tax=Halorubrum glutamatedens TaxID=2707018 RepID=A0ABD5QR22_9EURY|nr:TIGR04206 family protein [Halobellus captivus]